MVNSLRLTNPKYVQYTNIKCSFIYGSQKVVNRLHLNVILIPRLFMLVYPLYWYSNIAVFHYENLI